MALPVFNLYYLDGGERVVVVVGGHRGLEVGLWLVRQRHLELRVA